MGKTLYDKIFESHIIEKQEDNNYLIYIDRHLIHEVTSPQAFEYIKENNLKIRNIKNILAVEDHDTPTKDIDKEIKDENCKNQLETLHKNVKEFNIDFHSLGKRNNGICHVVAPEQGFVLPGVTLVCGDSHTASHGAIGAMAFGIGTSEVTNVFATNTLTQKKMKNMRITINGKLNKNVYPKDIILYIIGKIGTAGGTGYAIEYSGNIFKEMSINGRLTVCNMTIEAGARIGIVPPNEVTFEYLKNREKSPKGEEWEKAVKYWKTLKSDEDAVFDKEYNFNAEDIFPQVTFGTSPEDVINLDENIPTPKNDTKKKALQYTKLKENEKISKTKIDIVFIGSCTNSREDDLDIVANVLKKNSTKKIASNIEQALIVPGSLKVREYAINKGYDKLFENAGFEFRMPGCSMCLAMNEDKAPNGKRVASTSNRNFEGRQGRGSITHLMSPKTATVSALLGYIPTIEELNNF